MKTSNKLLILGLLLIALVTYFKLVPKDCTVCHKISQIEDEDGSGQLPGPVDSDDEYDEGMIA